jgi:hypothetical protein
MAFKITRDNDAQQAAAVRASRTWSLSCLGLKRIFRITGLEIRYVFRGHNEAFTKRAGCDKTVAEGRPSLSVPEGFANQSAGPIVICFLDRHFPVIRPGDGISRATGLPDFITSTLWAC